MRILSGIQPSGALHLGNYFGAIEQFIAMQNDGEVFYFIADWHALTSLRDGAALAQASRDVALDYLALGIDAERACIFRQSDVAEHQALSWILASVTPMALLERAHSYKDKVARGAAADVGLFTYPVLMSADILLYGADRVPVGQDQKQHIEIARDIATKFNVTYAPGYNPQDPQGEKSGVPGILKLPEPIIVAGRSTVVGLDGQKMSKSYNNTLPMFLPEAEARKKIMRMPTDSTPVEAPKPADAPLLALLTLLAPAAEAAEHRASWQAGGTGYGTYKKRLVELYMQYFAEARRKRAALAADPDTIDKLLAQGAERARAAAAPTFAKVTAAVGCGQRYGR